MISFDLVYYNQVIIIFLLINIIYQFLIKKEFNISFKIN